MPSIINLSFLPYQDYDTIRRTSSSSTSYPTFERCCCNNNVSCYPSIQSNISSFNNRSNYDNNNNDNSNHHYHYQNSSLSSTRTSPSSTVDSETYDELEEGETDATCGECGKILGPGWQCESCRRSCPYCNRALTTDPNDYCERCFRYCDKHDIIYPIVNSETQEGPKCPECRKAQEEEEKE